MSRTYFERWLAATVGAYQPIEDAFQQLLEGRDVNNAVGLLLEYVGKFVGRKRDGITDDEIYRRYIRAQISRNRSDGTPEDLMTIEKLVVYNDDAEYIREERGFATVVHRIEGVIVDDQVGTVLVTLVRDAASDGVRVILEFWGDLEEDMFEFSDADGGDGDEDDEDAGFADAAESVDDYDPDADGGALAYALD